jgi:hypothetical protein
MQKRVAVNSLSRNATNHEPKSQPTTKKIELTNSNGVAFERHDWAEE